MTASPVLDRVDALRRRSPPPTPSCRSAPARSGRSATRPPAASRCRRPAGIVAYEPADLTVTVGAGTTVAELDAVLGEHGQECPLDPRDTGRRRSAASLACGLSGIRRLRHGPLRDHVLEVRFVTGDGRLVKGGGPTVKNVTGYDLPRLFVGSFGTLGVLVQVTLRCRPRARVARWFTTDADPLRSASPDVPPVVHRWDGVSDARAARRASGRRRRRGERRRARRGTDPTRGVTPVRLARRPAPGPDLGAAGRVRRASAPRSTRSTACGGAPRSASAPCTSPPTTPTGSPPPARSRPRTSGWLLREAGAPGVDGFGRALPNAALMRSGSRTRSIPTGKLAPGRLPAAAPASSHA